MKICNYLCKYLSKQFGTAPRALGEHLYRASKDIRPPRYQYLLDTETLDQAAGELVALIELHGGIAKYYFQSSLDSKTPVFGWACSWGKERGLGRPPPAPS